MPSLERTAYPRFARVITAQELERAYTPSQEELTWARGTVRTPNHLLWVMADRLKVDTSTLTRIGLRYNRDLCGNLGIGSVPEGDRVR
jgi:hypothetical protein